MKPPTPEQIEAAAQAIRAEFADRAGRGRPWSALPEHLKSQYRAEAAAALAAAGALYQR